MEKTGEISFNTSRLKQLFRNYETVTFTELTKLVKRTEKIIEILKQKKYLQTYSRDRVLCSYIKYVFQSCVYDDKHSPNEVNKLLIKK